MATPKVLMVVPVISNFKEYRRIPEGLLRLKRYLEKKGIPMDIAAIDAEEEDKNYPLRKWVWPTEDGKGDADETGWVTEYLQQPQQDGIREIYALAQYSLIAISVLTENLANSRRDMGRILSALRKKAPHTPFVAGGFGVWSAPFQVAGAYKELDFVVYRWGEAPLEFLARKTGKSIIMHPLEEKDMRTIFGTDEKVPNGIYAAYAKNGERAIYTTGGWEEIPEEALNYYHSRKDLLEISTQLGCAYGNCTFCQWAAHTTYQQLPPEWVLENIERAHPKIVRLTDACFLHAQCPKSIAILEGIKRLKQEGKLRHEFALHYDMRADAFPEDSRELVKLMKDAGTGYVFIGFESGSERVLREFRKGRAIGRIRGMIVRRKVLLERNVRAIDALRNARMGLWGYFILSSPNSETADVIKTLELMAYLAKAKANCDVSTNPAVLEIDKSCFCIDGPEEGCFKRLWPSDPLAILIAKKAHAEFDRWRRSKSTRNREDDDGYSFAKPAPDQGEEIIAILEGLNAFIGEYLRLLGGNLDKEQFLGKLAEKKYFGSHRDDIGELERTSERVWREYMQKGRYREECRKGVTFIKAAMDENERLGKVLGSKDLNEQKRILLG